MLKIQGFFLQFMLKIQYYLLQLMFEKQKYIFTLGRLVPEKGFDDLIDAFNKEKPEGWKLVVAGDADHEDDYSRSLKARVKENKNIIMPGFLKGQPLNELFSHAGLFVLPSYHEGLPIVLLEAMSYGLSCLASDIPANRNVELEGDRFFKVGDINLFALKIKYFIGKSWETGERDAQQNIIANKYSWSKIADKTFEVYKRVVS